MAKLAKAVRRLSVLALLISLGGGAVGWRLAAAEEFPVVGGYGLAVSQPATTTCRPIGREEVAQVMECEFLPDGRAFGLPHPFHSCQVGDGDDYLIYATQAQCNEALETMRANSP